MSFELLYEYVVHTDNNPKLFKQACALIERELPCVEKEKLLIDVDGSTIQGYVYEGKEIIIYDDYDIGVVLVKSDVDLVKVSDVFSTWRLIEKD